MSYAEKLQTEIANTVEGVIDAGRPLEASWITHAIIGSHRDAVAAEEDAAEFWLHTAYSAVREQVRRFISKRLGTEAQRGAQRQMTLPGFKHVQAYYLVHRDDDDVGIPAMELSDAEIDAKAEEYRSMGAACFEHADELERFKHWRAQQRRAAE